MTKDYEAEKFLKDLKQKIRQFDIIIIEKIIIENNNRKYNGKNNKESVHRR